MVLEGEGARVLESGSAEDALRTIENDDVDVVLADVLLPSMSGIELLEHLVARDHVASVPVILISGHATVSDAVRATRLGAFDFFEKPLARDRVLVVVRNALRQREADRKLARLRARMRGEIIGDSPAISQLMQQIAKVANSRVRLLIQGESGTGKELVARALHESSERRERPFVKVNCAAIPGELIESELFGHERGAFTGATAQKKGMFEIAHEGTIFLDEIGDMSLGAQAKVLRVLQSGELMRVGSERAIATDVRVIAATHRNLLELVQAGEFREDLYFRLAVVPIVVPPLRERQGDIELLVEHFIELACAENGLVRKQLTPEAARVLEGYAWPGNVRELRNVIERMVILSDGDLDVNDVPADIRGQQDDTAEPVAGAVLAEMSAPSGVSLRAFREAVERAFILQRLEEHGWNVSRTADALGVERTHLHKKMRSMGIQRGGH